MSRHNRVTSMSQVVVSLMVALMMVAGATGADWVSLQGRFVLDGDVGEPAAINVNKDTEFCSKHSPVDETMVVGEGGELANVFVYLYLRRGKSVEVHPDLESPGDEPVVPEEGDAEPST